MSNVCVRSFILLCVAALLGACDGNGSNAPAEFEIVVTPSLGKVVGGGTQALDANGGPLSDEVDTGDDGTATLRIPASHAGPVIIRVRGRAGATYFDEASRRNENFADGRSFRVAMTEPRATVGASILTELAVRLVEASGQAIDAAAITASNEQIRAALAPEVADLLTPPAVVDENTMGGDVDDSEGGRLAARLGALASLAGLEETPALAILQQLADDVADGRIDGFDADNNPIMTAYSAASFAADFVRAVQDFAAAFGSTELQARAETAEASSEVDDGNDAGNGGGFVTEPGTVASGLIGEFELVYFDSDAAGRDPFVNDELVTAIITQSGTLTLGNVGPLADPFLQSGPGGGAVNPAEIIWEDPVTGLLYALSNNETGVFNEINIGDPQNPQQSGFPGFVGQLSLAEPTTGPAGNCGTGAGTSLVTNCAGTYNVTESSEGFHPTGVVLIGADGSVDFDGTVTFAPGDINEVFDRLSVDRRIQINYGADDDGDVILLFLNEALDTVETIVYRNRGNEVEVTLSVVLSRV